MPVVYQQPVPVVKHNLTGRTPLLSYKERQKEWVHLKPAMETPRLRLRDPVRLQ